MKTSLFGFPLPSLASYSLYFRPSVSVKAVKRSRFTAWDGVKTLGDATKSVRGAMIPVTVNILG